ncbi:hypothetical protein DV738_g5582, partial [Chaetothyriales sp. CBS 135597]
MALTSWKSFPFFTVTQVPVPADDQGSYVFDNEVTAVATGSDSLFLGTANGSVRILSKNLKVVRTFAVSTPAGAPVNWIKQVPDTAYLVTVSEDLPAEPQLKVWALDKIDKKTGSPKCVCSVAVQNGRKPFPVSAFVVVDDLSQVAVGFANGSVTVIRGDFIHDRGTRQRTVFESEDAVTGLEVREGTTTKVLYIATTAKLSSLIISGKGQGHPVRTVDNRGAGVGCMTQDTETGDIVIARQDAVYYYGPHGRGPSYAFDGPKSKVTMFKDYVGLVCHPRVAQLSKSRAFPRPGGDEVGDLFTSPSFTLLDTDLKFVAHTESLASQIDHLFIEWGALFLVTADGKLFRYQEKTLQQKLEILYQRDLFIYAVNLAQKCGADKVQQNIIFRKYGDYLYQKGDYDTAMQQYLRAIENTEPSQVIRKFLDTQRIHNLVDYLEELHEHDAATADHTTLLLNCYAKLKNTEKLDDFIRAPGELKFDLDTAIAMCRQGGYFDQAAYLATKHGENEVVIDILIEDSKKYAEALQYIWRLEAESVFPVLMEYARSLLIHCPEETTKLFIDYYTGNYVPKQDVPAVEEVQDQSGGGASQYLSALWTIPFMKRAGPDDSQTEQNGEQNAESDGPEPVQRQAKYSKPRPRTAFSSFIAHPAEFITFLEALDQQQDLPQEDRVDIATTLLEMYLDAAKDAKDPATKARWETKATKLITNEAATSRGDSSASINTANVLLLSSLSHFPQGTTLVREKAKMYADIFRSHSSAKDTAGVIAALRKYGSKDLNLYPLALAYFASSAEILAEPGVKEELQAVLRKIDEENLMAPLQVVKILSQGGVVNMGMVKDYLAENIARERKEIENNRRLIDSYQAETASKKTELHDLGAKPVVFQARRCSSCSRNLSLPTVHFLCKHSFHQECLNKPPAGGLAQAVAAADGDNSVECPICKPGNDTIKAIRRQQVENSDQHKFFRTALAQSSSRFDTVSDFFGRGVMTATSTYSRAGALALGKENSMDKIEEETLDFYNPSNFYPAYIGQVLASKYKIVGKLGYGASSTVWLAKDLLLLRGRGPKWQASVSRPPTSLEKHLVTATPRPGAETARSTVENDIKATNIMLGLEDDSVLETFEKAEITDPSRRNVYPDRTVYQSRPIANPGASGIGFPVLCDFGLARFNGGTGRDDAQPEIYRAPEIFDIFYAKYLFNAHDPETDKLSNAYHLSEMVAYLGPPPLDFLQRSDTSWKYFDRQSGKLLTGFDDLSNKLSSLDALEDRLEGQNRELFLDFVRSMLQWDPQERWTARELIFHPWLKGVS